MADPRETLARIRKRTNAATEGPWETEHHYNRLTGEHVVSEIPRVAECMGNGDGGLDYKEDAEFIAHARTDVPWLLEQVDRRDKALEKVLRLHPRVVVLHADPEFGRMEDDAICGACIVNHEPANWPCPTVEAIRQHLGEDA